jgi:hypothetical protein
MSGAPHAGYPCSSSRCLGCPPKDCVSLESDTATVTNGVATVQMTCHLSTQCRGAFLICLFSDFCHIGPSKQGAQVAGGRMAGSDFTVPARTTRDVSIGLTALGEQVVSTNSGGFSGSIIVDMLDYGYVDVAVGSNAQLRSLTLTTTDSPTYPAGATAGCGEAVFVGSGTSCQFAQNVAKAYDKLVFKGNGTVTASSPVTGDSYQMQCTGGSPVVCRGGTNAVVEFYS